MSQLRLATASGCVITYVPTTAVDVSVVFGRLCFNVCYIATVRTSSSAVAERSRDALCLSIVGAVV